VFFCVLCCLPSLKADPLWAPVEDILGAARCRPLEVSALRCNIRPETVPCILRQLEMTPRDGSVPILYFLDCPPPSRRLMICSPSPAIACRTARRLAIGAQPRSDAGGGLSERSTLPCSLLRSPRIFWLQPTDHSWSRCFEVVLSQALPLFPPRCVFAQRGTGRRNQNSKKKNIFSLILPWETGATLSLERAALS
jgi:hypothetical protein